MGLTGLVHALLTWPAGGSALTALISVVATISLLVLGLIYRRYIGILGANRRRPAERQAYDALRNSLSGGNLAAHLYARWLTSLLDAVDRFFGDTGMADRSLFPHAFGLRTPAPLWTAPAFDRCLLLALIYPIVTIFVIWAISGHVGPAEAALQLLPGIPSWRRGLLVTVFTIFSAVSFHSIRATGWWLLIGVAIASFVGVRIATPSAVGVGTAGIVAVGLAISYAAAGSSGIEAIAIIMGGVVGAGVGPNISAGAGVGACVGVGVGAALVLAGREWQGVFLSFFVAVMISVSLTAAGLFSPLRNWDYVGPLLLFMGLLTLLNAPFDWASLGLTRVLLRRGLELGGWWPYFLALVDAALAAVVIVALTLVMVIGVQAFDELAVHGGGKAVLPLDALFDGISAHPTAPEYWWVYALLLSTMIPSLINLVIGGTSLIRGLPGLPLLLLRKIPDHGNVPKFDRAWIAAVLTAQIALGAALGIAAQVLLAVGIIGYIMPFFGLELLDMARGLAALNLPMQVWQLFTHLL